MAVNKVGKKSKVLITGVTGYLGSHIADILLKSHPSVHIIGTTRNPRNEVRLN